MMPTAPGTYVYDETVRSDRGQNSGTLNQKVTTESSVAGETRQSVDSSGTAASSPGPGGSAHQEVAWRSTGLYLLSETFDIGGSSYLCAFVPPVQELSLPLSVGRQWNLDGQCTITVFGQPINLKLAGTAKVVGVERVSVGGETMDTWIVAATIDITGSGAYSFKLHQVSSRRLAPRQGLEVSETSSNTFTSAQGSGTANEQRQVHSIHPR